MNITTVKDKYGAEWALDEYMTRETKKLEIRRQAATTTAELQRIDRVAKRLLNFYKMAKSLSGKARLDAEMKAY